MRSGTVSAPVQSCGFGLSAPNARYAAVQLLTNQFLYFIVEPKSRTRELYAETCRHLAASGMMDTELFGLATASDGEYLFADPDYKLSKYAPKNWRSSSTNGLDCNGKPLLVLHFRVKFYLESPLLLRDETSRHHYYRQLRYNVVARGLVHACASEEVLYLLAGLALQADFGDYSALPPQSLQNYFKPADYFPQQMVSSGSEARIVQTAASLHRAYRGLSQAEAENQFIREASSRDTSPLTHNSHLYRLKQRKQDAGPGNVLLAICTRGIELYQENSTKALSGTFLWNDIGKLCFDRKKFEIRALNWPTSGEKLTYYTNSDEKAKHLLALCRESHQFSMALAPRLGDIRRKEEEERKRYRDWGLGNGVVCHRGDQRISVISSTSSNTTSGIVSDRVHSLDESEDDLEMEIMINTPPAPSIESLALAHLQDSVTPPSPRPSLKNQGADYVDGNGGAKPSAGGAGTPATTDGSQCSSSCSTVVVAGTTSEPITREGKRLVTNRRQASTSSSLELGYSHTAQNSALSDTSVSLELDYSVQSAHTSSGVYTLRSSTAATGHTMACSSQTSGIVLDQSEGRHSRSGSLVSATGSFHGDGSDPSDAGRGTLLSAEELSDLIVGRSPKPRRGIYPSRATVSSTLDSDSDYVTLPPPPLPPPRSDSEKPSSTYAILELASALSSPEETLTSPLRLDDSLSNLSLSSRKSMEESILQQQIQFQHLNSRFSPQKQTIQHFSSSSTPLSHTAPKTVVSTSSTAVQTTDLPEYLSQPLSIQPSKQFQNSFNMQSQTSPKSPNGFSPVPNLPSPTEEANVRFISTKPHINILTAHASLVASTAAPSFAAPTLAYQTSVPTYTSSQRNYLPETRSYPLDPASRMKIKHPQNTQNLIPIVGSNNYLDVRGSGAAFLQHFHQKFPPPPPVLHPRQPPPPPPPPPPRTALQTVYTSQVTRSQIEQFKQQLYSDVDYVIYPMQDPAISKQEYMDSKMALNHYNQVYPPPPYPSYSGKSHMVYRSTPNVAVASGYIPVSFKNPTIPSQVKYASNTNLSSDFAAYPGSSFSFLSHYPSSTSPLYSAAASYSSSSTQSLRYDPFALQIGVPKLISPIVNTGGFTRTQSDDNILNSSYEKPTIERIRMRRPPPPIPSAFDLQKESDVQKKQPPTLTVPATHAAPSVPPVPLGTKTSGEEKKNTSEKATADGLLDIRTLREKSRNMDLPLISALCNDRSLLKQTNAFVMPRHPGEKKSEGRPVSWHVESKKSPEGKSAPVALDEGTPKKSLLSSLLSSKSVSESTSPKHSYSTAPKVKYPVSGLSTTQIVKPVRKGTSRHTHPDNKVAKVGRSKSTSSATTSSANVKETILPQ
ncbi:protein expanded-like isoform X2 [Macrosteles quadrilineatus]|uniref:protein expanded-like isoform X2 n=1 Tax=Macrosteles quadrilineatus TaxID=74068 RepID=UPI0023E0C3EF|nr:protein expanded-like isoform X2 [Macrosteles quadrilineatus]